MRTNLFLLRREEAAAYLRDPVERDSKKALKGTWHKKGTSESSGSKENHNPSSEKGKATKGRPAKNSKTGPTPPKQPRQSSSEDHRTPSQLKEARQGPAASTGPKKFKIPKRVDIFGPDSEDDSIAQGTELFRA